MNPWNQLFGIDARSAQPGGNWSPRRQRFLGKLDPAVAERLEFLGSFLREPKRVGSFAPSSPALAQAMVRSCDLKNARAVVEFGPGTGAFTRLIRERIGRATTFIAIELDAQHARRLGDRFPGLTVYHDSAEKVQKYLALHRHHKADYIISGLPWANMPAKVQGRILGAALKALDAEGMFITFAYVHACWLPRARRFRERLEAHFAEVKASRVIWRNVPPAFVYRCRLTAA